MGHLTHLLGVFAVVAAIGFGVFFQWCVLEDPEWSEEIIITGTHLKFKRHHGVLTEVWGDNNTAYAKALGL